LERGFLLTSNYSHGIIPDHYSASHYHLLVCVSYDLLGEGLNASYDKEMIKRLDELETLPESEKQHIFHYMDLIIRDYKTKKTYNAK